MKKIVLWIIAVIYLVVSILMTSYLLHYNDYNLAEYGSKTYVTLDKDLGEYKKGSLLAINKDIFAIKEGISTLLIWLFSFESELIIFKYSFVLMPTFSLNVLSSQI